MVLGTAGVRSALEELGVTTSDPGDKGADAVYVGWHPDCTMADIHAACGAVLEGAALYAASDVPFFATQSGPAFGYSCAIAGAIHRVTGTDAEEAMVVIGDDPRVEIEMARAGGALGIGVTTGTTSREAWQAQDLERQPHHVIDGLDELAGLGLLSM
jgi:ribonucleotide monophosphatase NagD (HAD superfamily)